ncbi:leucine-rich repeat protein [Enorma phocaeensis]|uniref:leucine-rich repeat protein n=1 Tax=Enorma phocaeensis TaxID=1871019 RepID=UPI002352534D|nr:leucine-rich repeat protein [Enorma phocaeensis]
MGFVSAKCPACAKSIEIPAEETEFFCPYCGSKFLRDAAYAFAAMPKMATGDADLSDFIIVGTTLTAYKGTKPHVIVPAHVTVISSEAFQGNKFISTVTIPDSLTIIETNAFRGCTSLCTVDMSHNVVTIEIGAFENCVSLQKIDFPRSLQQIGASAFRGCSSLVTAYVPSSCSYKKSDGWSPVRQHEFASFSSPTKVTEI